MNKLIIITEISGTGKSTLAQMLYNKIENSVIISFDKLSENTYDMIGFNNEKEKKDLGLLNEKIYKSLIKQCMKRNDGVIILEKLFRVKRKNMNRILNMTITN